MALANEGWFCRDFDLHHKRLGAAHPIEEHPQYCYAALFALVPFIAKNACPLA